MKRKLYQLVLQFPFDSIHDYDWMVERSMIDSNKHHIRWQANYLIVSGFGKTDGLFSWAANTEE